VIFLQKRTVESKGCLIYHCWGNILKRAAVLISYYARTIESKITFMISSSQKKLLTLHETKIVLQIFILAAGPENLTGKIS
jgi:hypothetical protein